MNETILVIDDKADVRLSAHFLLTSRHYQVIEAESPQQALAMLAEQSVQLILLDMNYTTDTTSGQEGLAFLKQLAAKDLQIPVVAMTAWSSVDLAVKAMQLGAGDFVEKPWDNQRLLQVVKQQLQLAGLQRQNRGLRQHNAELQQEPLVWQSRPMRKLMAEIDRLAATDATILLTGENGTGKSSIARAIHQQSSRRDENFVTVNMGAIPSSLFESEMFGHKKGAFTDAKENRLGRFEMAEGGTLFLDEIANIPVPEQGKLLRVLESGEFERVGSSITQRTNVRLISASNADFDEMMADGSFRADLFYRLNTIELRVPPLRERPDDLLPLAQHFVDRHARRYNCPGKTLAPAVIDKLAGYHWPGNIRELSHVIERAVLLSAGDVIGPGDIQLRSTPATSAALPLMTLDQAEQQLLQQALDQCNGLAVEAAQLLGISKSAIYRRMEKYDIKS